VTKQSSTYTPAGEARRSASGLLLQILSRYGVIVAFALMILVFSLARPDTFPTVTNLKSILTFAAPQMIVALGLTVVLVMQDFDLSIGSMVGLADGAAVATMVYHGVSWPLALALGLGLGVGAGLVSGFLVAILRGNSFIMTLAMATILTGVEYVFTDQATVFQGVAQGYVNIGANSTLGFSNQVWIALGVALSLWVLLDTTESGRYMYAIGGNPEAARLSGITPAAISLLLVHLKRRA